MKSRMTNVANNSSYVTPSKCNDDQNVYFDIKGWHAIVHNETFQTESMNIKFMKCK